MTPAAYAPTSFTAGDSVCWEVNLPDYSADAGWSVSYVLRGATKQTIPAAVGVGNTFTVTIPAATSLLYPAGDYWFFGFATNSGTGERVQFYNATCTVLEDPATGTSAYDGRTHCQKVLDAIEATLEGRASRQELSYMVSGGGVSKQLQLCSIEELRVVRSFYQQERSREINAERVAAGKKPKNVIYSRLL